MTWEQKPAPVQKCGNCGYQKIFISVYMLKCLTTSVVSYRRAVEKGENKIRQCYYYWYSALGPVWAETRVQSGDWYGSGTLHPGQVLRGSLPLLSSAVYGNIKEHDV